ncbi:MAG: hypothetical protein K0U75_11710 [Actinomycetia bacterium]|nr:hypothetical protein [Actinomycetes bacterium]
MADTLFVVIEIAVHLFRHSGSLLVNFLLNDHAKEPCTLGPANKRDTDYEGFGVGQFEDSVGCTCRNLNVNPPLSTVQMTRPERYNLGVSDYTERRHQLLANLTPRERRELDKAYAAAGRESKIRELARMIADRSEELNRRLRDS